MPALAYLLPPLSGAIAFLSASGREMRFHGLQSVFFGVAWPLLLYAGSVTSRLATTAVFLGGLVLWISLLVSTARGRALHLPLVGAVCARLAESMDAR